MEFLLNCAFIRAHVPLSSMGSLCAVNATVSFFLDMRNRYLLECALSELYIVMGSESSEGRGVRLDV